MDYEVVYLNVENADAILIKYSINNNDCIILIDSGSVSSGEKIKDYITTKWYTNRINLAICTHPDSDHIGGFFYLFNDREVIIEELWVNTPHDVLVSPWGCLYEKTWKDESLKLFMHPTDSNSINLIDLAKAKGCVVDTAFTGKLYSFAPLLVLRPTREEFVSYANLMLNESKSYSIKTDDSWPFIDTGDYSAQVARSEIDSEKDDGSVTNASSIILVFHPKENHKFLFLGDANRESIKKVLDKDINCWLRQCVVKVPHHGSRHNLSSSLIDKMQPKFSVISAKGTVKHPSRGVVYCLARYGRVYSTHCNGNIVIKNGYLSCEFSNVPLKYKL